MSRVTIILTLDIQLLGWCKSNCGFALLNFAIWYWSTFLNKCGYVIHQRQNKAKTKNLTFKKMKIMASWSYHFMASRWGNNCKQWQTLFSWAEKITANGDYSYEIKRCLLLRRKAMTNPDSILKRHYFANKDLASQSYCFSSSHIWMWELNHKEG